MDILNQKNIIQGITIVTDENKLYIGIDRNCLSASNLTILEKISTIYCETLFYTDNKQKPNLDRLEYWCPDDDYAKETNIAERCSNKETIVLELDLNDEFTILGTSIMFANVLQEQDPMSLKINDGEEVVPVDLIKRHEHYIVSNYPDLNWFNLTVDLNMDNPLYENPWANKLGIWEINNPSSCDNMLLSILVGYNEKKYLTFSMKKEELAKVIEQYFCKQIEPDEPIDNNVLAGFSKSILIQ